MNNRTALRAAMPAMFLHEGWWDGWYRDVDPDGKLLDERRVKTFCEFPDKGEWHYIQHNWLEWADGRKAEYEFGGKLDGELIRWETDRFSGYGWETHESTIMLRLDRLDVPGSYSVESIHTAPGDRTRMRTWNWFKDGKPWKRTLCDEWKIEAP